jgi:hypothetical protein
MKWSRIASHKTPDLGISNFLNLPAAQLRSVDDVDSMNRVPTSDDSVQQCRGSLVYSDDRRYE